ncbi:MAG: DNA-3-methyladenine glycosylase [Actinomycetota bacterium]|nr:DNA-3-methyladenine glycosylase [Actinomycetota bacterium]
MTGRPQAGSALEHLRTADPVLRDLIDDLGPLDPEQWRRGRPPDPYGALLRSIVGQQLSAKAARSIFERLCTVFGGHTPAPAELLAADPETIRGAGLSGPKVAYMRDLADRVETGELALERLCELSDEAVAAQLTAVKGLGRWTADMFLIFHLGRPDVLPVGDQGIRRAVGRAYGLAGMPGAEDLTRIAQPWRPHRSLACLYLWRSLDAEPA